MNALCIFPIAMALGTAAYAQQAPDPYLIGVTLLSFDGCPVFIGGSVAGSPAERAGVRPGDQVLAVEGMPVKDDLQAAKLFQSNRPTPVTARLARNGKEFDVVFEREKRSAIYARNGRKIISGAIVSPDTTDAEVERDFHFDGQRIASRVFPTHYPDDPELFYGGFEIFILRNPMQVAVGGIEDGPASRTGVHWGDVLISVNGVPISAKRPSELEQMFSAKGPALMRLQIDRLGVSKTIDFHLKKAREIAGQNGKRFVGRRLVPVWASDEYLHCFLK